MNTSAFGDTLSNLMAELVDGAPESGSYMLNRNDPGLLGALDALPAEAASAVHAGGASIAAHVDHLCYGLSLMNRWSEGENPFGDADWTRSWQRSAVTDAEWAALRAELADEAHRWMAALRAPREVNDTELAGMVGSIAHLGYHLGAIRQMDRSIRGPAATD